jgi:hypothetical protein
MANEKSKAKMVGLLLNSPSVKSLVQEAAVATRLLKHKWNVVHGYFYVDGVTGKTREVDIFATQIWTRNAKPDNHRLNLNLTVECKSLKDFHLVFSETEGSRDFFLLQGNWIGWELSHPNILTKRLSECGVPESVMAQVMKQFEEMSYPKETMRAAKLHTKAPPAAFTASAFRETNIGGERDIDSSVIWKASQALQAAVSSFKKTNRDGDFDAIRHAVDFVRDIKSLAPVETIAREIGRRSALIDLYHPILIVESSLWRLKAASLISLPWCRFVHASLPGATDWWIDVVSADHMTEYFDSLTRYYRSALSVSATL